MTPDGSPPPASNDESSVGTVTRLFAQARQGDANAFSPLWQHFFPRLVGLARKRLSGRQTGNADAEDAAQAALFSFWKQVNSGRFLDDLCRDSLWNLLAKFTVHKVGRQLRHETTHKRGGGHVLTEGQLAADHGLDGIIGSLPTQELDLQAEELIEVLPADLQQLVMLKLLGYSAREISEQLNWSQRKVQRKLELVWMRWNKSLTEA